MNTAQDKKHVDHNGYWYIEKNPISRTGVFPYLGKQISDELEPDKVYQVYRPAEELFSPEAMASFKLMPLVDEHTMLGKDYTPAEQKGIDGVLGEKIERSGDMLTADIKIYSESLKDEIRNGKKELSMGYFCDYDLTPGTYKGQHYDAVQRNLRGNHIALVDKGRMGREVRVMDKALNIVKNCPVHDSISIDKGINKAFKNFNGSDEAAVNKENTMDRREVIREIMAIAAKDPGEFKGGEEEKIKTISALAEKLAYGDGKEDKPESDNITTAVPEEKTKTETKTENEEEEDAARCDAEPQAVQGTRLEIKALPPEKDDVVKKAADMAAEKVSKNIYEMQELKARITPHIGEFDSSKMRSVADMADYALRKMGKKAKGDKVAYLEGCLSEMKQERQLYGMASDGMATDGVEADTLDEILKGVK